MLTTIYFRDRLQIAWLTLRVQLRYLLLPVRRTSFLITEQASQPIFHARIYDPRQQRLRLIRPLKLTQALMDLAEAGVGWQHFAHFTTVRLGWQRFFILALGYRNDGVADAPPHHVGLTIGLDARETMSAQLLLSQLDQLLACTIYQLHPDARRDLAHYLSGLGR